MNLSRQSAQAGGPPAMKYFPLKSAAAESTRMTSPISQGPGHRPPGGSCAIGILAKAPRPGSCKTRLCPPLTPQESVALSRCFLQDTVENVSTICLQKEGVIGVAVYQPNNESTSLLVELILRLLGDAQFIPCSA